MSEGYSWLYTCGFCCLYPIVGYLLITWLVKQWSRIDWNKFRFPWSRYQ